MTRTTPGTRAKGRRVSAWFLAGRSSGHLFAGTYRLKRGAEKFKAADPERWKGTVPVRLVGYLPAAPKEGKGRR